MFVDVMPRPVHVRLCPPPPLRFPPPSTGNRYTCGFTSLEPRVTLRAGVATSDAHQFRITSGVLTSIEFMAFGAGVFSGATPITPGVPIAFPTTLLSITFSTDVGQTALTTWSVAESDLVVTRSPSIKSVSAVVPLQC